MANKVFLPSVLPLFYKEHIILLLGVNVFDMRKNHRLSLILYKLSALKTERLKIEIWNSKNVLCLLCRRYKVMQTWNTCQLKRISS